MSCYVDGCSFSPGRAASTEVPRPEPEGAIKFPAAQYPSQQKDYLDAYDDKDEQVGLLEDYWDGSDEVALADVGLQPSVTRMASESLLPATEETPVEPMIGVRHSDVVASAVVRIASSDTALSPSRTAVVRRAKHVRHVTDTDDSYVDTDRDYPLTKAAIKKLHQRQKTDTSTDEDRRKTSLGADSGRHFPPVRKSVTPESAVTVGDSSSPGRSSTSTFLFDSDSSDSDAGVVVRTRTLRAISKMKRKRSQQKSSPDVLVTEAEPVTTGPGKVTVPGSVRDRSRSQKPQTHSSIDRAKAAPGTLVDVASVPVTPSPAPQSDHKVEIEPPSQTAPPSRTATPAGQLLPSYPGVPDRQPTPVTHPPPVSQAGPTTQPVHVPVDNLKVVQKTERTDADGRKTTVYKLSPKVGPLFTTPWWPSSLRSASFDAGAAGDRALPAPAATIRLGESKDAPGKQSLAAGAGGANRRSTGATVSRLKTLANQRGDNVLQTVLQEIQGTPARPQVRSAGLAQVAALQEPLTKTASEDTSASQQDKFSAQGRLTYAPFKIDERQTAAVNELDRSTASFAHTAASDQQLPDDNRADTLLYSNRRFESGDLFKAGASNSLSNFTYLSGEHTHTELPQRLTIDVSVPDATDDANVATSQFLQDRFNSQKRCFKGLSDSSPRDYLYGVRYEGLQPETKSLLDRISKLRVTSEVANQSSQFQRTRSSFLSDTSDQRASQARPDYPQQPSSSKLQQVGRRLNFSDSDAAQPDESLRPSFSKIVPKQTAPSSLNVSRPDEFLQPSLQRMTSVSTMLPASLDYPQQPSSSEPPQVGQRLSVLPSDAAQSDTSLHPSLSRIAATQATQSSLDMSRPDEFLHPSLHRMTSKSTSIPASVDRPQQPSSSKLAQIGQRSSYSPLDAAHLDEFLHPSLSQVVPKPSTDFSLDMSNPDEFLHPSMHRMTLMSNIPARPDDAMHSSETRLLSSTSHVANYDEAQHPSLSRLQTKDISQSSPVPAKFDDYLHPSLTRVQGPITGSGRLRTDVETTTTTTAVTDRGYFLYDEPARPDDILHPSSTRIVSTDSTSSEFTRRKTSGRDVAGTELQTAVPANQDDTKRRSSVRLPARDHAKMTDIIETSEDDAMSSSSVRQDGVTHPSFSRLPTRDQELRGDSATATSITSLDGREMLALLPSRADDALHPSSTQLVPRHSAQARATFDTATLTRAVGSKDTLPSVFEKPHDIIRPPSTQFAPHENPFQQRERAGFDYPGQPSSSKPAEIGRRSSFSPSGAAYPDEFLQPSLSQVAPKPTADSSLDVPKPDEFLHPSLKSVDTVGPASTMFSSRDSLGGTFGTTTLSTAVAEKEALPSVTTRPHDMTYSSSENARARATVYTDTTISSTMSPDASARSDDVTHSFSAQSPLRGSAQGTFDTGMSTIASDWKETLSPVKPDDMLHVPLTRRDGARATLDSATSATASGREETMSSVVAKPDDVTQPSSTQQDSTRSIFDGATSTAAFDSKETPGDVYASSSTEVSAHDSTRGTFESAATSVSHRTVHDDWTTIHPEERKEDAVRVTDAMDAVRSSLRRRSDMQQSEDEYQTSLSAGPEASYPSEVIHPSLTGADVDRAISDSPERPSSVRITDRDYSRKAYVDDIMVEDERRPSILHTDETQSGRTGLLGKIRRSSMKSVFGRGQTVPSTPATTAETSTAVDSGRQRRTVTWLLRPRAKSEVDAKVAESVPSVEQRSLPSILDSGSPSRASTSSSPSAMMTDWSYGRISSDERKSTTSDITLTNNIDARDSRDVTREHLARTKQQQDTARSDEYSDEESEAAATIGDEPTHDAGTETYPSSETASEPIIAREAATADDVSLRREYSSDSSSVADRQQFAETEEDSLLESPSASVSRPPFRDLTAVDKAQYAHSTSTTADVHGKTSSIRELETPVTLGDDAVTSICTTSYESSSSLASPGSSGCDVTNSTTFYDASASLIPSTLTQSRAVQTSRFRVFPGHVCHRETPGPSRTFASRNYPDGYTRQAYGPAVHTTTHGRDYCFANIGVYQSPFARGYVPPTIGMHRSPGTTCQSSRQRQSPTNQVSAY